MPIEDHQAAFSLEISHKLCYTHIWWNTYQHMHMVYASFCLYDLHTFLLTWFSQYYTYIFFQCSIYFFSSVFRCENYVILTPILEWDVLFISLFPSFLSIISSLSFSNAVAKPLLLYLEVIIFAPLFCVVLLLLLKLSFSPGRTGGFQLLRNKKQHCFQKLKRCCFFYFSVSLVKI